jgi:polysaccharide chain length determinant protein (PEP-CTERM system associated)
MPTEQGGYFSQLQSEIDLTKKLENDLNVAISRRSELARQLRGESVIGSTAVVSTTGNRGASDTVSRINEAQARLDELLLRYTDKHPDVIAARETLAELKARRASEIEKLRSGDAAAVASSGVSTNPVYQNIQLQLNQADVEIASLRGQVTQHHEKAADLRKRLDIAPKVEAEFAQLNRDYDTNKALYTTLLGNYEKAQLGERADNAGSVRFDIVQPPTAPFGPVFPRRTLFLVGALAAALAAGAALAYLLHLLRPVVSSVRGLSELTELPVLGVVSAAFPRQLTMQAKRSLFGFLGAGAVLACVFVVVLLLNHVGFRIAGLKDI